MSARPVGQRLRCPKCGKLLSVAHLPPGGWVECVCKPCKHGVIFASEDGRIVAHTFQRAQGYSHTGTTPAL